MLPTGRNSGPGPADDHRNDDVGRSDDGGDRMCPSRKDIGQRDGDGDHGYGDGHTNEIGDHHEHRKDDLDTNSPAALTFRDTTQ
ncbi:hypothetical protein MSAR_44620 [Mycolicibacterium sarraceniae]|uniref:Uncharacterized protein n=1 Tax=Mycolicibacterium sarraceniae TaxID=1534348 RepID=A0A7I7SZV2_9MYCO|nr:hypothetical protein MSAR_44620 [Mycolicibacterium sarraceniae]